MLVLEDTWMSDHTQAMEEFSQNPIAWNVKLASHSEIENVWLLEIPLKSLLFHIILSMKCAI